MLDTILKYSDVLLTVSSIAFSISLLPQLWYNFQHKVCEIPYLTSIPTTFFMAIVTLVYLSNGFPLATKVGTFTTIIWGLIAIQRYMYKR